MHVEWTKNITKLIPGFDFFTWWHSFFVGDWEAIRSYYTSGRSISATSKHSWCWIAINPLFSCSNCKLNTITAAYCFIQPYEQSEVKWSFCTWWNMAEFKITRYWLVVTGRTGVRLFYPIRRNQESSNHIHGVWYDTCMKIHGKRHSGHATGKKNRYTQVLLFIWLLYAIAGKEV